MLAIYVANLDSAFWVRQIVGNLFLFLPIGLLGPIVVPALNGWLRVLGASIGISLMIEVTQLGIPSRSADIDDLLLNVAGAMLGYAILVAVRLGPRPRGALAEPD
jgi:glycopeptide antibiotics resistance protein